MVRCQYAMSQEAGAACMPEEEASSRKLGRASPKITLATLTRMPGGAMPRQAQEHVFQALGFRGSYRRALPMVTSSPLTHMPGGAMPRQAQERMVLALGFRGSRGRTLPMMTSSPLTRVPGGAMPSASSLS